MQKVLKCTDSIWKEIEGEMVLLNPKTGEYFGLNEVGASFCRYIDGNRTVDDIIVLMSDEYDVDMATLTGDINSLVQDMTAKGLLKLE